MEMELGPFAVLFSWQACIFAFLIVGVVHVAKMLAPDRVLANGWVKKGLLPSLPILLGAGCANAFPLYPDALMTYMAQPQFSHGQKVMILCAYGVVVGQFSSYVWDRFSSIIARKPDDKSKPPDPDPTPKP